MTFVIFGCFKHLTGSVFELVLFFVFSPPSVGSHQCTLSELSAVHSDDWDDELVMTAAAGVYGHLTALGRKGGLVMK